MTRLGIVSDTHGLLRPETLAFLQGCDQIVHAGDIGTAEVLARLQGLAPVTAVRGNNDQGDWAAAIPPSARFEFDGIRGYVLHDLALLDIDPAAAGIELLVSGHSHRPSIGQRGGLLCVNPGSAGPRRFRLPVSAAEVRVNDGRVSAHLTEFNIPRRPSARAR